MHLGKGGGDESPAAHAHGGASTLKPKLLGDKFDEAGGAFDLILRRPAVFVGAEGDMPAAREKLAFGGGEGASVFRFQRPFAIRLALGLYEKSVIFFKLKIKAFVTVSFAFGEFHGDLLFPQARGVFLASL